MVNLTGLHPDLIAKTLRVLATMKEYNHPMVVVQALRTVEQQAVLYAQGRTSPGKIVTNCDGVKNKSRHQAAKDGFGHAVDCAFWVDGKPSFDPKLPWTLYGELGKALGLVWGGNFAKLVDRPHLEMV